MSDSDSFIHEVSEEVRRDRLFGYFRRYGWIGITAVLLLVGGAAFNEYRKAQIRNAAEARGDAILAALEADAAEDRQAALEALPAEGGAGAVVRLLAAASAVETGEAEAAAEALAPLANDPELPQLYRDLAILKRVTLLAGSMAPDQRIAALESLTVPGGAYRVLAEEQIALAEVEMGETDAARERLGRLTEDTEATAGLRRRASQLIMALGGRPDPA